MDSAILIIIIILIVIGIVGFFIIRDLIFLINYFEEQREIIIYNKKYKKYRDEKKRILDKRLQHEKELKKEHGLDYLQEQNVQIVGFVEPKGHHSKKEFERNFKKYSRIAKAAKEGKSLYWRTMLKIAKSAGREKSIGR